MLTALARSAATAALIAAALVQPVKADEVLMFDRPPTVEEVQGLLAAPPRRTRGIEIIGEATKAEQHSPSTAPASQFTPDGAISVVVVAPPPLPIPVPAREETPEAFGFRINFAFDSAVIPADAFRYIDAVGQVLRAEPDIAILIEGHTDAVGGDGYNLKLSERRARAVESYLIDKYNVRPERIRAVGKGKREPLTANPFDRTNRRVQFARTDLSS